MAINSGDFITVANGDSIVAAANYLYARKITTETFGGISTKLIRSVDGVDWVDDPANITDIITLISGSSYVVLVGETVKALNKSGSTWVDVSAITSTPTGGRYIGGKYFVFAGTTLYYSSDAVTWLSATIPFAVKDVGYDGTHYLIVAGSRIYKTSNFSSFSAFPLSVTGCSIAYLNGNYWVGSDAGWGSYIYSTDDLNDFTHIFTAVLGTTVDLDVVDGVLVFGGNRDNSASLPYIKGIYYYDPNNYYNRVLIDGGYGDSDKLYNQSLLIHDGYVYASAGIIRRAAYNANWKDTLVLQTTGLTSTVDEGFSGSVGTASGGVAPYTWVLDSKTWADSAILSTTGVLTTTITTEGSYSLTVTVTDSSQPQQTESATIAMTVGASPYTATIQGTLRLDTSDGAFAARKVYLYNYTTGDKVAETTSDGTTGEWSFTQVAPGDYFVVGAAQGDDLNVPRDFDAMGVITITE